MKTDIFEPLSKIMVARRPAWKFLIEDSMVRIMTYQFIVDWQIIEEMQKSGDYEIVEVISHNTFGVVITIRYTGGT